MLSEMEIEMLLRGNDIAAFRWLYEKYAPSLYGLILKLTPDSDTAGTFLEESFVKMWLDRHSYNASKSRVFTWILGVTISHSIKVLYLSKKDLMVKLLLQIPSTSQLNHSS